MATPEQIRAAMAGLSPDQQRAFMSELEKRHAARNPSSDAAFWGGAQAGDPHTAAPSQLTGEDAQRGLATSVALAPAIAGPMALGAVAPTLAANPVTSGAIIGGGIGGITGGWKGALRGALEGAGFGHLSKVGMALKILKSMRGAAPAITAAAEEAPALARAAPAALSTEEALIAKAIKQYPQIDPNKIRESITGAAPAAAEAAVVAPAAVTKAALPITTPADISKAEAAAKLEALLGNAVNEGRIAAAGKEAAKGNRQLAEKILGDLQGEGVLAP
jgi:hypothetical protein